MAVVKTAQKNSMKMANRMCWAAEFSSTSAAHQAEPV